MHMAILPLHAKVECSDGHDGELVAVTVNLQQQTVTSLIVLAREKKYRVPLEQVMDTSEHLIFLRCDKQGLENMEPFAVKRFVCPENADEVVSQNPEGIPMYPNASSFSAPEETELVKMEIEYVPEGEATLHRGTCVETTDETLGQVSELLVNLQDNHITHFVVSSGGLLRKHEIQLPLLAIDHFADETIYVRFDKQTLGQLPANQSDQFTGGVS
jgi:RNA binding exosome subunit